LTWLGSARFGCVSHLTSLSLDIVFVDPDAGAEEIVQVEIKKKKGVFGSLFGKKKKKERDGGDDALDAAGGAGADGAGGADGNGNAAAAGAGAGVGDAPSATANANTKAGDREIANSLSIAELVINEQRTLLRIEARNKTRRVSFFLCEWGLGFPLKATHKHDHTKHKAHTRARK
jgi:hypothetical protein